VEAFQPLIDFYALVREDPRIGAVHISLYGALLLQWREGGSVNPVAINRQEVMGCAKIRSRQTYNRCMRELHSYGYIVYCPSFHPGTQSTVTLKRLT
jgi:hypothetical protein